MSPETIAALRDVTPQFGYVEEIRDGRLVRIPKMLGEACALYQDEQDGRFIDDAGMEWETGWLRGEHVKRRVSQLL